MFNVRVFNVDDAHMRLVYDWK